MKPKNQQAYSVQVDNDLLKKAKKKINLPDAIRDLVYKVVGEKVCPCCGSKLKVG